MTNFASIAFAVAIFVCMASADGVEAVHLYKSGSAFHEERANREGRVEHPEWKTVRPVSSITEFNDAHRNEPLSLAFFYVPWSDSCIKFYSRLDELAAELKASHPSVPVIAVDLNVLPDLGKEYQVNTLPTFSAFRHGILASPVENQFPRHADGVVKHIRRLLLPAVDEVESASDFEQLVNSTTSSPVAPSRITRPHEDDRLEHTVVVGFFEPGVNHQNFIAAARLLGGYFRLALVTKPQVAKSVGQRMGTVVIFRRWADGAPVSKKFAEKELVLLPFSRYLIYNAMHPVGVFDEDTKPLYMQRHKPLLMYFSTRRLVSSDPLFAVFAKLGIDEELNVTTAQTNPNTAGHLVARFLGLEDSLGARQWAVGLLVGRKKFRFGDVLEPTEENLRRFVTQAVAGQVPEHKRSEKESVIRSQGQVSDLAFIDFDEHIVNDTARDAIILCYHPRSHSSQELVAIFDDLAEELKTVPGVLVGRMNVLENDYHDAYAIPGYPSILYARKDRKLQPIRFSGVARTIANVKQFIVEHAAVSLGGFAPSNQTPSAARSGGLEVNSDEL